MKELLSLLAAILLITPCQCWTIGVHPQRLSPLPTLRSKVSRCAMVHNDANRDHDLLVRVYRGEDVHRTPVWLMRQAGRYMADFRKFSDKLPFRTRSETPEVAVELSLQPWRRFGVDGVILFSDILTPLPALGVDFTIIGGKGPQIMNPIRTVDQIQSLRRLHDIDTQLPFLKPILTALRDETAAKTTLIGFIGAPWTLAAYSVEGGHSKLCAHMKTMCIEQPQMAHALLDQYTSALCDYAAYQIAHGVQVLQVFESWAHHLSEDLFVQFAKPYAARIASFLQTKYPHVPVVYFANGGSGYLHQQLDMGYSALSIDWQLSMATARKVAGPDVVLAGNIDPIVLYGSPTTIEKAVERCLIDAGRTKHVMNLGHGVEKDTSEEAVATFVEAVKTQSLRSTH